MRCRWIILAVAGMLVEPAFGQTLRLRPQAQVAGKTVCVGDVATLEGLGSKQAEQLANTVVINDLETEKTIRPEELLFAVMASGQRDLAIKLQVSGSAFCAVSREGAVKNVPTATPTAPTQGVVSNKVAAVAAAHPTAAPAPVTAVKSAAASQPAATQASEQAGLTLATTLTSEIVDRLSAPPEDVQVSFDTLNPLLEQTLESGQRWQSRMITRSALGTVQWEAQLVSGGQITKRLSVQAKVQRKVQNVVCNKTLEAGDVVLDGDLTVEERWIDRKIPTQFTRIQDVAGQAAQRGIAAGSVLDQRDFKPVQLVARDGLVTLYVVSGGLRIKTSVRATEAGRLHDRITVRNEKTGERLNATVIGKNLVVLGTIDEKTEVSLREQS